VQAFLRNVAEGKSVLGEKTWEVDRADLRGHFNKRLDAMGGWKMAVGHARWSDEVDRLAEALERLPSEHLMRRHQDLARAVIDAAVWGPSNGTIDQLEAARVLRLCLSSGVLTRRYCEEVRLVGAAGPALVTSLGQALIGLGPVDSLKWLLIVETEQSNGTWLDDWRTPKSLLVQLLEGLDGDHPETDEISWPLSHRTFARLEGFGLVFAWIDDQ